LSGVLSELKPGFLQIVFSRIRRRVHDNVESNPLHRVRRREFNQRSACLTKRVKCVKMRREARENATYVSSENSPPNYRFCLFYWKPTCSFEALVIVSSTLAMAEIVYQQGTNCERTSQTGWIPPNNANNFFNATNGFSSSIQLPMPETRSRDQHQKYVNRGTAFQIA